MKKYYLVPWAIFFTFSFFKLPFLFFLLQNLIVAVFSPVLSFPALFITKKMKSRFWGDVLCRTYEFFAIVGIVIFIEKYLKVNLPDFFLAYTLGYFFANQLSRILLYGAGIREGLRNQSDSFPDVQNNSHKEKIKNLLLESLVEGRRIRESDEKKVHKIINEGDLKELFLAFVKNEDSYDVYLVNPVDQRFRLIKQLTGALSSGDYDVMETSKSFSDLPDLPPFSYLEIESSNVADLDFIIWFEFDLVLENGYVMYIKTSLPKYGGWSYDGDKVFIPEIGKKGLIREILNRDDGISIKEKIKTMNMNSRYITYDLQGKIISEE